MHVLCSTVNQRVSVLKCFNFLCIHISVCYRKHLYVFENLSGKGGRGGGRERGEGGGQWRGEGGVGGLIKASVGKTSPSIYDQPVTTRRDNIPMKENVSYTTGSMKQTVN